MVDMRLGDCMDLMRDTPDGFYDLAIVDPPYGIGMARTIGSDKMGRVTRHETKDWDCSRPEIEYFVELIRVTKNQIVWGGNYFADLLPPKSGWIFWDKQASADFSDGELAWTSFDRALEKFVFAWMGMRQGDMANKEKRIHPTQKPVALYKWLLSRYAKPGWKILDTHGGSGSICIACHDHGFDLTWIEKDADYFAAATARYKTHASQLTLIAPEPSEPQPLSLDL